MGTSLLIELHLAIDESARQGAPVDHGIEAILGRFAGRERELLCEMLAQEMRSRLRSKQLLQTAEQNVLPGLESWVRHSQITLRSGQKVPLMRANLGLLKSAISFLKMKQKDSPRVRELVEIQAKLRKARLRHRARVVEDLFGQAENMKGAHA